MLLTHRLTVVHAPAGSGKTTLLSQWHGALKADGVAPVWYSANDADRDLLGFADGLAKAFQIALSKSNTAAVNAPDGNDGVSRLISVVLRLSSQQPTALFIDDYHLAEAGDGGEAVSAILATRMPQLSIVLASRTRPSIPLGRLRVSGEILEVPMEDLFFSQSETEDFFRATASVPLSAQEARTLHDHTEGWAAGLRLASLVVGKAPAPLKALAPIGSQRAFAEYFMEEVIHGLPGDVLEFLTKTSILDALNGGICDAITGRGDSGEVLDHLERKQLFVAALPGSQRWYKYHHLFQEFLQNRLLASPDSDPSGLHTKAAQWFIEHASPIDGVRHAFQARNPTWAAELIETYCLYDYLSHGRFEVFSRWMQQLPREARDERPLLLFLQVWRSINLRRFLQAEQTLGIIERSATDHQSRLAKIASDIGLDVDGRLHLMKALIGAYGGDFAAGMTHIEELRGRELDKLPFGQVDLDSIHSYLAFHHGTLELAEKLTWRANGVYDGMACHWGGIHSRSIAAMSYLARGLLGEAKEVAEAALEMGRTHFNETSYMVALPSALLGLIAYNSGDLDSAEKHWKRAVPSTASSDVSGLCERILIATVGLARICDETDRVSEANSLLVTASRRAYEGEDFRLEFQLMIERANRAFRLGNSDEAIKEWQRLVPHVSEAQRRFPPSCWQIWDAFTAVEARFLADTGQTDLAVEKLRSASQIARTQERELSARQLELLAEQIAGEIAADVPSSGRKRLETIYLAHPRERRTGSSRKIGPSVVPTVSGLTEREEEVLELMRWGLSNNEIAQKLSININTVKSHSKNVFSKLGVKSRTQAVLKVIGQQ